MPSNNIQIHSDFHIGVLMTYNGLSALMLAVVRGHVAVVRELTAAGANLGLRGTGVSSFSGKTALDLALARDEPEMIEILQSASKKPGER